MMEQLRYGLIEEFEDGTTLWYEPITDTIDGFVLRKHYFVEEFNEEIDEVIRIWQ